MNALGGLLSGRIDPKDPRLAKAPKKNAQGAVKFGKVSAGGVSLDQRPKR